MQEHIPDGLELTPFDETFHQDPYSVYAKLRKLDPVHEDKVSFFENSWSISEHRWVKQLLADPRLCVDPRSIGLRRDPRADNAVTLRDPNMMNLDEPEHSRLRSLVHKAFTPSSVAQFTDRIKALVEQCLNDITTREFDLVSSLSKPIPTMTIAEYIGIDSDRHQDFKQWTDSLLLQGYPVPSSEQWQEILQADKDMREYMSDIVEQRSQSPREDLVSRLVMARDDDTILTTDEVVEMCFLLVGAGNFTTTDLISNSLHQWLVEPSKSTDAEHHINETLRYDSPVMAVRRYAKQDIQLGNQTIPAGSVVNLITAAANHDPKFVAKPDVFNSSNQSAHLSFGRGIHHCLGAPLAKLEAKITLQAFQKRFPNAKLQKSKRSRRMDFRGFSYLYVDSGV